MRKPKMTAILQDRLAELGERPLLHGAHKSLEEGMCAMEAAAWIAGEPWSDHPQCVCPVIAQFMRSWNDSLADEERTAMLADLIPLTIGTRASAEIEQRRAFMCVDWTVREFTPTWLESCGDRYATHVKNLRESQEITSTELLVAAKPILIAMQKEANAAWDAAWAAARAAAWDAARDAAWAAARAAAWDAAWDAAWAAAWAAARAALKPTKQKLQQSAKKLVRRMCAE